MNALFNVSDRYAVVLVTYISQLTTVFFGIKEFHEGTAMEFHEGCICCAAYVVFAAQHPERSWQFQIMTAILDDCNSHMGPRRFDHVVWRSTLSLKGTHNSLQSACTKNANLQM